MIPSLQSETLVREVERQFEEERNVVLATAERDASAIVAEAYADARKRMHLAIEDLRRERDRRLMEARAQREAEERVQAEQQTVQAIEEAWPLLREALSLRWKDLASRRLWSASVARFAVTRLRHNVWSVEHPQDWSSDEQKEFVTSIGSGAPIDVSFKIDARLSSGLRIAADQAIVDATSGGLLADHQAVAALLLDEIDRGEGQ